MLNKLNFFSIIFFITHILVFTDYSKYSMVFRTLNIVSIIAILFYVRFSLKYVLTFCAISLFFIIIYRDNVALFGVLRLLHFFIVILLMRELAKRYLEIRKNLIISIGIILLLCFVSLFINIGVEVWEARVGRNLVQFSGIMSSPNYVGGLAFFALIFLYRLNNLPVTNIVLILLAIYLGLISRSRVFLGNVAIQSIRILYLKHGFWIPFWIIFLLVGVLIVNNSAFQLMMTDMVFIDDLKEKIFGSRTDIVGYFVQLIETRSDTYLGSGYGTAESAMFDNFELSYSFHSSYFNLIVDLGLLGFILLLALIFYSLYIDFRNRKKSGFILVNLLIMGMLTSVFEYGTSLYAPFFWLLFFAVKYEKNIFN
jgi:hypothetical protein